MVRVAKVLGGPNHKLALVQLPKDGKTDSVGTYIIDKTMPSCKVEINHDKKLSFYEDKIFVRRKPNSSLKTFYFVYLNYAFEIDNALAISMVEFPAYKADKKGCVLIVLDDKRIDFYSFSEMHDNTYQRLGHIDNDLLYSYLLSQAIQDTFVTKLVPKDEFYYIDYNGELVAELKKNKKIIVARFSLHSLQSYMIPSKSKTISDQHENPTRLPKYYVTPDHELFDVFNFRIFHLSNMFTAIGSDYMNLFYKIFDLPNGQKYVFISKKFVDFSTFESPRYLKEYQNGAVVQGVIYDLNRHEFVTQQSNPALENFQWVNFFIYDSGLPHVYEVPSENEEEDTCQYVILYKETETKAFSKLTTDKLPTFLSHIYIEDMIDSHTPITVKKRIIFAKIDTGLTAISKGDLRETHKDFLIVLNENLNILHVENDVAFEAAVSHDYNTSFFVDRLRLAYEVSKNERGITTVSVTNGARNKIFHLLQNDSFIYRSCNGELGNLVLVPLDREFHVDYKLSFFYYSLFYVATKVDIKQNIDSKTPFLKVMGEINDFENDTLIINLNDFKTFEYDRFTDYAIKNFSIDL